MRSGVPPFPALLFLVSAAVVLLFLALLFVFLIVAAL